MREAELHEQVWKLLVAFKRPDVLAFHVPNGALRNGRMGTQHVMGVVPGAPDFVIIVGGRPHFLELKSPRGRVSRAQEAFCEAAQSAGATYDVVRSLDETCGYLNGIGALRLRLSSVRGGPGAQAPECGSPPPGTPFTEEPVARA